MGSFDRRIDRSAAEIGKARYRWHPFESEQAFSEALSLVLAEVDKDSKGFGYISFIAKTFDGGKWLAPRHVKAFAKFCDKMGNGFLIGNRKVKS